MSSGRSGLWRHYHTREKKLERNTRKLPSRTLNTAEVQSGSESERKAHQSDRFKRFGVRARRPSSSGYCVWPTKTLVLIKNACHRITPRLNPETVRCIKKPWLRSEWDLRRSYGDPPQSMGTASPRRAGVRGHHRLSVKAPEILYPTNTRQKTLSRVEPSQRKPSMFTSNVWDYSL